MTPKPQPDDNDVSASVRLPTDLETVQRLLQARNSCRAYRREPVPRPVIETWLRVAQRAASWCNTQPWQLVVTEGKATQRFRDALIERAAADAGEYDFPPPEEYRGACLARRRAVGAQLYESVGIARGDREASSRQMRENFRLFGAPHVAILTSDRSQGLYGAVDCGVYLGTLLIAAQAAGLGCIAQGAIARYPDFIREHFGIGDDRGVLCAVSFGYPDVDHPINRFRTERASLEEAVTWSCE